MSDLQRPHELRYYKIFKAKSATKRFQLVKKASLCTNCLGRGHLMTQCTARSCHICGQRHHTYLHREQAQAVSRSSSGRSSGSRSSHKRSSYGQSPSRSSKSRSFHNSRWTPKSSQKHTSSAQRDTKVHASYESRSSRTKGTASNSSSKSQPEPNWLKKQITKRGTELTNISPDVTLHHDLLVTAQIDVLDRKELNHVQDKNGYTPPTENTTVHVTPDMDIISESFSPGPNVKNSPSPWPRVATPATDQIEIISTLLPPWLII